MNKRLIRFRRWLLKVVVPEWVWPKTVEIDAVQIQVRGTPYSFGIKRLLTKNPQNYELPERQLCKQAVTQGDYILEMGGSIGILARILAHITGNNGRVISIEADRSISEYSALKNKVECLTIIQGYAFPLYDHVQLDVSMDNTKGSLGGQVAYTFKEGRACEDLWTIKRVEDHYHIRPNILVVDIEGSEAIICERKPNFPEYLKKIIIELHPDIYGHDTLKRIIDVVRSEGFNLELTIGHVCYFSRNPLPGFINR